ncbi:U3 small nucleolar RNA-associated protein 4 [Phlyctochytrium planicorne]|nr:U3 small nucleolar RNA-associated protein 4 [Phlyctochytrium planicorne]
MVEVIEKRKKVIKKKGSVSVDNDDGGVVEVAAASTPSSASKSKTKKNKNKKTQPASTDEDVMVIDDDDNDNNNTINDDDNDSGDEELVDAPSSSSILTTPKPAKKTNKPFTYSIPTSSSSQIPSGNTSGLTKRALYGAKYAPKSSILFHRCRFVDHMPSAINALAFSPEDPAAVPGSSNKDRILLACARDNGDLEIWNPMRWHLERVIPGVASSKIESIVWIKPTSQPESDQDDTSSSEAEEGDDEADLESKLNFASRRARSPTRRTEKKRFRPSKAERSRLLTASLDGYITEWDLQTLMPLAKVESGGGAIWCMAVSPNQKEIVVGCRILSVAYHPMQPIIAAGSADSCIRTFSTATRRCLTRSTLDTQNHEETCVWTLTYLPDGTLVSGDSLGTVIFWDSKSKTVRRSFRAHGADVLCLAVGKDGDVVFSSGVDRKVVQYRVVETPSAAGGGRNKGLNKAWIISGDRRYHSHDVRALALCDAKPVDSLISGGLDTILTVSQSVSTFPHSKQIRHNPFPQRPLVSVANKARLVMCRYDDRVKIWRLGKPIEIGKPLEEVPGGERVDMLEKHKFLAEIKVKSDTNLIASSISNDGTLVAVSDLYTTKLFRLTLPPPQPPSFTFYNSNHAPAAPTAKVARIKQFPSPSRIPGSLAVAFTPDSRRMVLAGLDSVVRVVEVGKDGGVEVLASFSQHVGGGEDGEERELVMTMAVSADGQWLTTADLGNRMHVFNLDALKYHATLPRFATLHTSLSFHPSFPIVTVTTCGNELFIYDVEEKRLTDWSREYSHRLPERFVFRKEIIMGVVTPLDRKALLMIWAGNYVCSVDLDQPVGPRDAPLTASKRKRAWTHHFQQINQQRAALAKERAALASSTARKRGPEGGDEVIVVDSQSDDEDKKPAVPSAASIGLWRRSERVSSFSMDHRFGPLMYFGFVGEGEAVAVELPLLTVVEKLPPGFSRKRYGN